ncbi:hypothetical protein PV433_18935 [Paenibacillus sp. GYB004]|uniref:hypothetical protein n=1 Tax=Paenibacillus sp. GYB004 TaxID=2994393 RepID=UPI002F96A5F4
MLEMGGDLFDLPENGSRLGAAAPYTAHSSGVQRLKSGACGAGLVERGLKSGA